MDIRSYYVALAASGVDEDSFVLPQDATLEYVDLAMSAAATPAAAEQCNFRIDVYRGSYPYGDSSNLIVAGCAQSSTVTAIGTSMAPVNKFCPVKISMPKGTKLGFRASMTGNGLFNGYVTFALTYNR